MSNNCIFSSIQKNLKKLNEKTNMTNFDFDYNPFFGDIESTEILSSQPVREIKRRIFSSCIY